MREFNIQTRYPKLVDYLVTRVVNFGIALARDEHWYKLHCDETLDTYYNISLK